MTLYTGSGSLPAHIYCHVESAYVRHDVGNTDALVITEPCVWFGLRSYPGRAWGCHIMLECGAVVRDIPLHALSACEYPPPWAIEESQHWDCYGASFSALAYTYLHGLEARIKCGKYEHIGDYLFTVCPMLDAFSATPEQSKEFMFFELRNGRFTAQPTNRVLFIERSFTERSDSWPTDIKRQTDVFYCERESDEY